LIEGRRDHLPAAFSARDIQRRGWTGLTEREAVADALDMLIEANRIRAVEVRTADTAGRPSQTYEWNPLIRREG
jgi:hypothetical protein